MLSDTQIVKESFVEDVNNLLNKGDVPNLFAPDERNEIITSMQSIAKKTGRELRNNHEATAMFTERVRQNLHVVLCFSPIGASTAQSAPVMDGAAAAAMLLALTLLILHCTIAHLHAGLQATFSARVCACSPPS